MKLHDRSFCVNSPENERDVLHRADAWHQAGRDVMLATVVKTWGSAPRAPGSLLAIASDGALYGSVSGGCIEDDLLVDWQNHVIARHAPSLREYGVDTVEARRFGLPCGGTIQLVIEPITARSGIAQVLELLHTHALVERRLHIPSGTTRANATGRDATVHLDGEWLVSHFGKTHRLLLIGAGQPSAFIAANALALGYDVTVCDPREEHASTWCVPGVALCRDMPDDVVIDMQLDERSAVIALTHDPKLDDLALMEALKRPAFYIGAIGSRRSHAARCERLKLFDVTADEMQKLRGPAGIFIGASTPIEIGLSILADLTAHRRGVPRSATVSVAAGKAHCAVQ